MKEETKIEVLKIAAQLAVGAVQHKAKFDKTVQCLDIKEIFEMSVALVNDQYETLDKPGT